MGDHGLEKGPQPACSLRIFSVGRKAVGLLLACSFLLASSLTAQPKAFVSLQPARIETGDTTGLIILVSGLNTEPKEIDFSPWASILPPTNIIAHTDWNRSGALWTRRFTLIAFDSATLVLPPLKVRVAVGNPLETNELTLTVFPTRSGKSITEMAKIRDIRREPESWRDYWAWGAGLLVLLLILGWWLRKNRHKKAPVMVQATPDPIPVSASEQALQKIAQLQQKKLWKHGLMKDHYAALSLILREFIESRYGIAAMESTTTEIWQLLKATDFPDKLRPELNELLQKSDMVKYAQSQLSDSSHESLLERARAVVAPGSFKREEMKSVPANSKNPSKRNTINYEAL